MKIGDEGRVWFWHFACGKGRLCVAALIPPKGKTANKYHVGLSWTSPSDMPKFTKVIAREMAVGRLLKSYHGYRNTQAYAIDSHSSLETPHDVVQEILDCVRTSGNTPSWAKKAFKLGEVRPARNRAKKYFKVTAEV